jgi:hypothetical protein
VGIITVVALPCCDMRSIRQCGGSVNCLDALLIQRKPDAAADGAAKRAPIW